jgi:hypothetical protein
MAPKNRNKSNRPTEIVALILSFLGVAVGVYIFSIKMAGSRTLTVVEGAPAQIAGSLIVIGGLYNIISIFRSLKAKVRKK